MPNLLTHRPVDGSARERMRDVQRREASALDAVTRAERRVQTEQMRTTKILQERNTIVARAVRSRDRAISALASVSGTERTALLLSESVTAVRRCCRSAASQESPGPDLATPAIAPVVSRATSGADGKPGAGDED
jgi:hypothetical protein